MNRTSSCPRRRRWIGCGALGAALVLSAFSGAAQAEKEVDATPEGGLKIASAIPLSPKTVYWTLQRRSCLSAPQGAVLAEPCGDLGNFYFFDSPVQSGASPCNTAGDGDGEDPPPYNMPAALVMTGDIMSISVAGIMGKSTDGGPDSPAEELIPCAEGSCLASQPGGSNGLMPWAASIDWADWHGWTTAATQKQISGLTTYMFPLLDEDNGPIRNLLGEGVGDAHVLVQMCRLAESSYNNPTAPPRVLSMSFGRTALDDEPQQTGDSCDPDTISCQLKRVFDYVRDEQGVEMLAAAGNHQAMHFPAFYPAVTSVGTLDMAAFGSVDQRIAGVWESPGQADAYMPGYGVCLDNDNPDRLDDLWPAPAGSSYATAILAGWIADGQPIGMLSANPPGQIWAPTWATTEECYVLAQEPATACNTQVNTIIARILGQTEDNCWTSLAQEPNVKISVDAEAVDLQTAKGNAVGLDEFVSEHEPAPAPDFCIPCSGGGGGAKSKVQALGGGALGATAFPTGGGQGAPLGAGAGAGPIFPIDLGLFVIDLSGYASYLGDYSIFQVFLRIGDLFFPVLDRAQPADADILDGIGSGEYNSITIQGLSGKFPINSQPSLFYTACEDGNTCYWSSVPILMI